MVKQEYFEYEANPIPTNEICNINKDDLDSIYNKYSRSNQKYMIYNIYFILLYNYIKCKRTSNNDEAAHLAFLMSYYIFKYIDIPEKANLSKEYIKQAINKKPLKEYTEWYDFLASETS